LNSSMFNAARLAGPSIAGAIIAVSNEGWCFLIDGVSFLAVIVALLAMRVAPAASRHAAHAGPIEQLKEGWQYATSSAPIRSMIGLVGLVCLLGVPYGVLLPLYAGSILGGGPHTLGFLMTASGSGALLGAFFLATRRGPEGLYRVIPIAAMAFGAGLIGFALSRLLWLSLGFMVLAGFGLMVQFASSNTLLQTVVDDNKRGRVLSFFLMAYFGTTPLGSLVAGSLAARYGAPVTLAIGGACCIAGAVWFRPGIAGVRALIEKEGRAAATRVASTEGRLEDEALLPTS
jgi:MFS family permease